MILVIGDIINIVIKQQLSRFELNKRDSAFKAHYNNKYINNNVQILFRPEERGGERLVRGDYN